MRSQLPYRYGPLAVALLALAPLARAETTAPAPDNTGKNVRDRNPAAVTADDQTSVKTDVEVTRAIRKALTDDSSLSTYAHNLKIITDGNDIVLKGPVRTRQDKDAALAIAKQAAAGRTVRSEIEIAPQ